jgi:hypothetical protein
LAYRSRTRKQALIGDADGSATNGLYGLELAIKLVDNAIQNIS